MQAASSNMQDVSNINLKLIVIFVAKHSNSFSPCEHLINLINVIATFGGHYLLTYRGLVVSGKILNILTPI